MDRGGSERNERGGTILKTIEERLTAIESRLNSRELPNKGDGKNPVGKVLRQRRKAYGLSMSQVNKRGGPSTAFQCDIENEHRANVTVLKLIEWCAAIGCEPIMVFADIYSETKGATA